jgi:hypothetical protein
VEGIALELEWIEFLPSRSDPSRVTEVEVRELGRVAWGVGYYFERDWHVRSSEEELAPGERQSIESRSERVGVGHDGNVWRVFDSYKTAQRERVSSEPHGAGISWMGEYVFANQLQERLDKGETPKMEAMSDHEWAIALDPRTRIYLTRDGHGLVMTRVDTLDKHGNVMVQWKYHNHREAWPNGPRIAFERLMEVKKPPDLPGFIASGVQPRKVVSINVLRSPSAKDFHIDVSEMKTVDKRTGEVRDQRGRVVGRIAPVQGSGSLVWICLAGLAGAFVLLGGWGLLRYVRRA